jgi:anthranilate phosphoribosyltransferase
MTTNIQDLIARAKSKQDLSALEMEMIIFSMLEGSVGNADIGELLLALREKGEAVSELVGAALALRRHKTTIKSSQEILLDTCGTGGDGSGTFNISTAAAIVIAAAGIPVAKHGNRAITSRTGSADVLSELQVKIDAPRELVERCLSELGICFCFAPQLHPAMRHVAEVRRQLGVRTLFNLLGPLCNPADATHQLLGTGDRSLQRKLAAALQHLGIRRGAVVCGSDGMDEVTLTGVTHVLLVNSQEIKELTWVPKTFGLEPVVKDELAVAGPKESARMIRDVLDGKNQDGARRIVLANAAAGLWLAEQETDMQNAVQHAANAIDSGRSARLLDRLAEYSWK